MTAPARPTESHWRWPAFLVVGSVAAFLPAIRNGFVNWDDDHNFLANLDFGPLSPARVAWAWVTYRAGVYQPLAWMSFEAQASAWQLDPRGYHAASVLLHAANAVTLQALALALIDRCRPVGAPVDRRAERAAAGLAALLFAVHPLRVEVVAWASCQPYLPSVFCALMATRAYLRAHPTDGPSTTRGVAAAWAWYVAAVLFKSEAITLPAVFVLLDVYPLRRIGPGRWAAWGPWREKVPFAVVGLADAAVAVLARRAGSVGASGRPYLASEHLAEAAFDAWFYPAKTAWPTGLSTFYGMPESIALTAVPYGPAAVALAVVGLGAFLLRRRRPAIATTCAAYVVLLSPHLGFVPSGPVIAADRYCYLATIPWAILLAGALARPIATGKWAGALILGLGLGLATVLAALSWAQCGQWRTSEVLLGTVLRAGGARSPEVRASLAYTLLQDGRPDEAAALCDDALAREPDYFKARYLLGVIRARQGRFAEAEREFAAAVRLIPDDGDALYNLGVSLARRGEAAGAIEQFERSLKARPTAEVASSLAILLSERGRADEAITAYELSLRLAPDQPAAHNNLGALLVYRGRLAEAERHFRDALRLRPGYAQARRGIDLIRQRRQATSPAP